MAKHWDSFVSYCIPCLAANPTSHMQSPWYTSIQVTQAHWEAVKQVYQYLAGAMDMKLSFGREVKELIR